MNRDDRISRTTPRKYTGLYMKYYVWYSERYIYMGGCEGTEVTMISYTHLYEKYHQLKLSEQKLHTRKFTKTIDLYKSLHSTQITGFDRLNTCRKALDALDRRGWERSYHQRMFHDHFLRACARIFWKTYKPGRASVFLSLI